MSTANFHSRIERIQKAQELAPDVKTTNFREPGVAGVAAATNVKRRQRHPVMAHMLAVAFGIIFGGLVAVALMGLTFEGSPWGPGTQWREIVYFPTMAGMALAPTLMIISLFVASRRPGVALFSLGYLSGIVVTLLV